MEGERGWSETDQGAPWFWADWVALLRVTIECGLLTAVSSWLEVGSCFGQGWVAGRLVPDQSLISLAPLPSQLQPHL